jgi:hypothetical protein
VALPAGKRGVLAEVSVEANAGFVGVKRSDRN